MGNDEEVARGGVKHEWGVGVAHGFAFFWLK